MTGRASIGSQWVGTLVVASHCIKARCGHRLRLKCGVESISPRGLPMESALMSASRRDVVTRSLHLRNDLEHSLGLGGGNVHPENRCRDPRKQARVIPG